MTASSSPNKGLLPFCFTISSSFSSSRSKLQINSSSELTRFRLTPPRDERFLFPPDSQLCSWIICCFHVSLAISGSGLYSMETTSGRAYNGNSWMPSDGESTSMPPRIVLVSWGGVFLRRMVGYASAVDMPPQNGSRG